MTVNLQQKIKEFKLEFDPKLKFFFEKKISEAKKINPISSIIVFELLKLSLAGGKRLRPMLMRETFNIFANNQRDSESLQNLEKLELALEIFQLFCLVHDDIIDESETRRGILSIHKFFEIFFKIKPQSQHLGVSAGILAGDLANIFSEELFLEVKTSSQRLRQVWMEMKQEVAYGQSDDTLGVALDKLEDLTEDKILNMLDYKSGRYSIQKPMLLGSILAGVDLDKQNLIARIGLNLGLIFQITDDILGLFGEEESTGKSNLSDIQEGKKTLLILKTWQNSTKTEKQEIESVLGNLEASLDQVNWLKDLVKKKGSVNQIKKLCLRLDLENKDILEILRKNGYEIAFFAELGSFLLSRSF